MLRSDGTFRVRFSLAARRVIALLAALACAPPLAHAQTDAFQPNVDDTVTTLAVQPDGRILIGGEFGTVDGAPCPFVCRLLPDGRRDASFAPPAPDAAVNALVLQPDGRIVINGQFSQLGTVGRTHLARLLPDGRLDPSLTVPIPWAFAALALEANGDLLVGSAARPDQQPLLRIRANGTLDAGFAPVFDETAFVAAIAVRPDGSILLGGRLRTVQNQPRTIALLQPDGSLDARFDIVVDDSINAIALQPDGRVLLGGGFLEVDGQPRTHIARLEADGTLDPTFDVSLDDRVGGIVALPDGRIVVEGSFATVNGQPRADLVRLRRDGSLDSGLAVDGLAVAPMAMALQPDGKLVVGGLGFGNVEPVRRVARFDLDDRPETGFKTSVPAVRAIAQQPDGRLLLASGRACDGQGDGGCVVRTFADGTRDDAFAPVEFSDAVTHLLLLPDRRVLAWGTFDSVNGRPTRNLVRLSATGALDLSFVFTHDMLVHDVLREPDGRLLVIAVDFAITRRAKGGTDGVPVLRRLQADGALDVDFGAPFLPGAPLRMARAGADSVLIATSDEDAAGPPGRVSRYSTAGIVDPEFAAVSIDGGVDALQPQPDGRVLIGGRFSRTNGQPRADLVRVLADGSVDTSFNTQLPPGGPLQAAGVLALALRDDGRIAVAMLLDEPREPQQSLVLLEPDGARVVGFGPIFDDAVHTLTLLDDGKLLAAGDFTRIFGELTSSMVRLATPGVGGARIVVERDDVRLVRGPAAPESGVAPRLSISFDGALFVFDAPLQRIGDAWGVDNAGLPVTSPYFLRLREATSPGGSGTGQGLLERVALLPPNRFVFADEFESNP